MSIDIKSLVARRGLASEVVVGDWLSHSGGKRRDDIWEIIAMSHGVVGEQIPMGNTLWWRARNVTTDVEVSTPPRTKAAQVRFMVTEEIAEAKQMPEREITWPADSDEMALLLTELGATEIARRDHKSGIITCPLVEYPAGDWGLGRAIHLRVAHGIDLGGLTGYDFGVEELINRYAALRRERGIFKGYAEARRLYPEADLTRIQEQMYRFHGMAHDPNHPTFGKTGFPHIHED